MNRSEDTTEEAMSYNIPKTSISALSGVNVILISFIAAATN